MDKKEMFFDEIESESYNAFDKPFDFVKKGGKTALVCDADSVIRTKLSNALGKMDYYITESATARDALRSMRFHVYHLIVINESFDVKSPSDNYVLDYIRHLPMNIRRNIFVTLLSAGSRTMDNMAAFGESVNLIVNLENIDDAGAIIERGITDNEVFYSTFKDALRKEGHV